MGKFGWSLPPGVRARDLPGEQTEYCTICFKECEECICPECPVCQEVGRLECYSTETEANHGLKATKEQLIAYQEAFVAKLKAKLDEEQKSLEWMKKVQNPFSQTEGSDMGEPYMWWWDNPNKWEDITAIRLTWG